MKVIIFCPQFSPAIGGAERQAQRQAAWLSRRGIDVEVWTPMLDPGSPPCEQIDGVTVNRFRLLEWPREHRLIGRFAFLNGPALLVQTIYHLWRPVRRANLVHCHMFGLATLGAAICARLLGKAVICKAATAGQGSDIGELSRTSPFNRLVAPLGRRVFTRWISTTDSVGAELQRAGVPADRIVKIPNGIEVRPLVRRIDRVRRILYVGRLSTNMNRDTDGLVRAFDGLACALPDAELAVVGGGDLLDHTRQLVALLDGGGRIQVPGFADPSAWLEWADCFVLPSRREGLSNALLEAMERGLPCIANDIGPNREVLADGAAGVLVPVGDAAQLTEALLTLSAAPDLAARLSTAARQRIESVYSMNAVGAAIMATYQELAPAYFHGEVDHPSQRQIS
jgi:glycosyltransferase involved in cell wall biosynthesis